jgi:hypothetical protein
MYNHKSVQSFIDKVNKEAEEAAQKVYDKYNPELLQRIQNQIKEGDTFWVGMGVANLENKDGNNVGEELALTVGSYWQNDLNCGFSLPSKFNKTKIIKE